MKAESKLIKLEMFRKNKRNLLSQSVQETVKEAENQALHF